MPRGNMKGAGDVSAPLFLWLPPPTSHFLRLTSYLSLLTCHQFRQPALLPRGRVLVDDVLLAGTVEQLDRVGVRRLGIGPRCRANLSESGSQLTPLGTIGGSPHSGLAHTLGGGLDSGHGNLSQWVVPPGAVPG